MDAGHLYILFSHLINYSYQDLINILIGTWKCNFPAILGNDYSPTNRRTKGFIGKFIKSILIIFVFAGFLVNVETNSHPGTTGHQICWQHFCQRFGPGKNGGSLFSRRHFLQAINDASYTTNELLFQFLLIFLKLKVNSSFIFLLTKLEAFNFFSRTYVYFF